ncbi:MAG: CotH kinase family protein [Clostridia bacterium]|nr:CotH kinase family protein [Clostridia bacterium]
MRTWSKWMLVVFLLLFALLSLSSCCQHDYQAETVSPTCKENGYIQYTCTACGDSYRGEELPAAHAFDTQATCQTRTCLSCKTVVRAETDHDYRAATVINPTCQSGGHTVYVCTMCEGEYIGDEVSIGDHSFIPADICRTRQCEHCGLILSPSHDIEEVETIVEPTITSEGRGLYRCRLCGTEWNRSIPALKPEDFGVPVIYLKGSIGSVTRETERQFEVSFVSEKISFDAVATLKIQGASSAGYVKKNYTIRFFTDKYMTKKLKFDPFGWGNESKYCLKANFVDFSQARNVVCGRLYGDVVRSRTNPNHNLLLAPNGGAIDGYPVLVYVNGAYHGFYTMNIPKDEWMFGMDNDDTHLKQAMLFGEIWADSVALKTPVPYDYVSGGWELEYCSTTDTNWVADSFNDLINFVNSHDGDAFRAGIGNYLDVDAAIDNMLFTYLICAMDNTSKNILWATYDGKVWIPSMYDMDGVCGMFWDGKTYNAVDAMMPTLHSDGSITASGTNNLWKKLLANYREEIIARYWQLREGPMKTTAVVARFDEFFASFPAVFYDFERKAWPSVPGQNLSNRDQIVTYMTARLNVFDAFFRSAG